MSYSYYPTAAYRALVDYLLEKGWKHTACHTWSVGLPSPTVAGMAFTYTEAASPMTELTFSSTPTSL